MKLLMLSENWCNNIYFQEGAELFLNFICINAALFIILNAYHTHWYPHTHTHIETHPTHTPL